MLKLLKKIFLLFCFWYYFLKPLVQKSKLINLPKVKVVFRRTSIARIHLADPTQKLVAPSLEVVFSADMRKVGNRSTDDVLQIAFLEDIGGQQGFQLIQLAINDTPEGFNQSILENILSVVFTCALNEFSHGANCFIVKQVLEEDTNVHLLMFLYY